MSLPRYPEYKPSGVEWLGELPGHWEELPLKIVASYNDDVIDETTDADQEILYVDISSVDRAVGIVAKDAMSFSAAPSRARRKVKDGDVIVSTVRTYLRAIARIVDPEENLVVSTGFAVIRPSTRIFHGFLGHLLSANFFVDEVIAKSVGVSYPAINASDLVSIKVPVPPIEEQQAIAAFLDRETGKIDALIAEQKRLVELLAEKRQAVISHAVTKGLNSNAPMKDSGIEWLGKVPEHWEVQPLRRLISKPLSNGIFKKKDDFGRGTRLINVFDIYQGDFKIKFDDLERVDCTLDEIENYRVDAGDFFFVRSSLKQDGIAVVAVAEPSTEDLVFECHLIRARPKAARLNPRYSSFLLNSAIYRATLIAKAKMTTMTTIDQEAILSVALTVPPLAEQQTIAAYLDSETAKFDTLTAEANRAIALLQERRSALISAAVTGKIDVRHACEVFRGQGKGGTSARAHGS